VILVRLNKYIYYLALYKAYNTIPDTVKPNTRHLLTAATNYIVKYNKDDESNKSVAILATLVEI
jgi:hypothetical protein